MERFALDITPHNLRDTAASLAIQAGGGGVEDARARVACYDAEALRGVFRSDLVEVAAKLDVQARAARSRQDVVTDHTLTMDSA